MTLPTSFQTLKPLEALAIRDVLQLRSVIPFAIMSPVDLRDRDTTYFNGGELAGVMKQEPRLHVWDFTGSGTEDGESTIRSINPLGTAAITAGTWTRITSRQIRGQSTVDPPNLADGAGYTANIPCGGAELGDRVAVSFSLDLQGIVMTGYVSAVDTVTVRFQNETGGAIDLGSGAAACVVYKKP